MKHSLDVVGLAATNGSALLLTECANQERSSFLTHSHSLRQSLYLCAKLMDQMCGLMVPKIMTLKKNIVILSATMQSVR